MNCIEALNCNDKIFYDKCADIALNSLYDMEEITTITLEAYQFLSIKLLNGNMLVEDMIEQLDKLFSAMECLYLESEQKFLNLCSVYVKAIDHILVNSNIQNHSVVEKRIMLSQQRNRGMFKQSMKELKILGDKLLEDCRLFQDEFFKIDIEDEKESLTKTITSGVNDRFEKAKVRYNKIFKQRDLIKYLELNGFNYKNTGRHANYTDGVNTIPVPIHGSKDLGYGLQRKIQKEVMMNKNI
ncbi:type II toxin-antitoxin system HicA family toxin [Clostridium beijerinckii]|uniref:type II toxin-antitoxin system HicA family toxin n=1 Tax=Clostridium beijerinckii TaxID=1520 RepID=UPI00181CCA9E|nr:type II toxin-antitoxin system HicA family toxin [Clostridium beijerinckii]NRU52470.1 putative RNA binding protein YcfA (HicA-like mRNA interferase family) [Clostridium beijerinckii]NYC69085.1 putative RNA binding protein YcfA (HicA-like mRNA interferase family) [Clostridium beijerinckii]